GRIDVLAAADDHVLQAVADEEVAVVVEESDVARAKPAIGRQGRSGLIRSAPVAGHHGGAARADLAALVRLADGMPLLVDEPDLAQGQRAARRVELACRRSRLEKGACRGALGHAVGVADGDVAPSALAQQRLWA